MWRNRDGNERTSKRQLFVARVTMVFVSCFWSLTLAKAEDSHPSEGSVSVGSQLLDVDTGFSLFENSLLTERSGSAMRTASLFDETVSEPAEIDLVSWEPSASSDHALPLQSISASGLLQRIREPNGYSGELTVFIGDRRFDDVLDQGDNDFGSVTQYGYRLTIQKELPQSGKLIDFTTSGFFGSHSEAFGPPGSNLPDLKYQTQLLSGELNYLSRQRVARGSRTQLVGLRVIGQNNHFYGGGYVAQYIEAILGYSFGSDGPAIWIIDSWETKQVSRQIMLALQVGYEVEREFKRLTLTAGVRGGAGPDREEETLTYPRSGLTQSSNLGLAASYQNRNIDPFVTETESNIRLRSFLEYRLSAAYAVNRATKVRLGVLGLSLARFNDSSNFYSSGDAPARLHYVGLHASIEHRL